MIDYMQKNELSAVMKIWLEGNLQAHHFFPGAYWQGFYKDVEQQIAQSEVYVYRVDDVVCGFLGLCDNYLAGLFVEKSQQGNGVGTALVRYAQRKKDKLVLHVYAENVRAVQFYQKSAFEITNQQERDGHLEYEMQWSASQ